MQYIKIFLEIAFKKITQDDWDNVWIITGDEGKGKTNLGLNLFDIWYTKLYGNVLPELIKYIGLDLKQFIQGFRELKQFEMIIYDEAGELSSMRMMDKFNYAVTQSYQVVRGANLFSILILPDVFYLNPFFSMRRARGLLHVYERGKFAFWNKTRMQSLIEINRKYKRKSIWRVKPLFHDHYPKYSGPLLEAYTQKKKEKLEGVREKLYQKLFIETEKQENELRYIVNAKQICGVVKASKIFEVTPKTIYNKIHDYQEIRRKDLKT